MEARKLIQRCGCQTRDAHRTGDPVPVIMVNRGLMKTTIEIPDRLFRKAKSKAAERGQTLKEFMAEALREKLASNARDARPGEPAWMEGFGKLRRLRNETTRVQACIDEAFEKIEPEDRA
jgi:hypothetical protein